MLITNFMHVVAATFRCIVTAVAVRMFKATATANLLGLWQSVAVVVSPTMVTLYQQGLPVKSARFKGPLLPVKKVIQVLISLIMPVRIMLIVPVQRSLVKEEQRGHVQRMSQCR